jgi:small subunit ribosomal protein S20
MANIASAKKSIRKTIKQTARNRSARSHLRTLYKRVTDGISEKREDIKQAVIDYISALDKAAKRGIVHENKARRHKSALAQYIFPETCKQKPTVNPQQLEIARPKKATKAISAKAKQAAAVEKAKKAAGNKDKSTENKEKSPTKTKVAKATAAARVKKESAPREKPAKKA